MSDRKGYGIPPRNMLPKQTTILLIDDEASQRRFIRRGLEDAGYTVVEGADYDEALIVVNQHRGEIDVLLTDVSLPGRNGYELARALLAHNPGLSVIFMSGIAGAEVCRFYGMATTDLHFLEKPFHAGDLVRRVHRVLESGGPFLTRGAG
jgi:DNA-binding NtrC family response regulator